jgi:hypothetical protein
VIVASPTFPEAVAAGLGLVACCAFVFSMESITKTNKHISVAKNLFILDFLLLTNVTTFSLITVVVG